MQHAICWLPRLEHHRRKRPGAVAGVHAREVLQAYTKMIKGNKYFVSVSHFWIIYLEPKSKTSHIHHLVNSAHADGGPRSPSAHVWPFARPPISMSGNFSTHMSAESPSNISPTPQKSYPKFRKTSTTLENNPLCPTKYNIVRVVGGVPRSPIFFRVWNPHIFVT